MSVPAPQPASDPSGQPGAATPPGPSEAASPGQWFAPLCGPASGADSAAHTDLPGQPDSAGQRGRASLADSLSGPATAAAPPAHTVGPAYSDCSSFAPAADGPLSAGEAMDMVLAGLGWLARADAASMPGAVQAQCLQGLERALSVHAAARARVLAAFTAQGSYEDDGQGSPRTWLTWQTKVTRPAASGALASMRSLSEHPAIAGALASGAISVSWGRQITEWTDLLPADCRGDADVILLAAAAGGADLAALAELAEEIRRRTARPDRDSDGGFADRGLRLATTLGGVGKLHGDLTGRCAAALHEVLDSLGKKAGPEDSRTAAQRRHDALEEACRRLLAAGCLPDRAGQPARLQLHLTLRDFLHGTGGDGPGDGGHVGDGPVLPGPAAGPGDDCDAALAPIVTGRVDHELLNRLAAQLFRAPARWPEYDPDQRPGAGPAAPVPMPAAATAAAVEAMAAGAATAAVTGCPGLRPGS